jgi:hypothetical protein
MIRVRQLRVASGTKHYDVSFTSNGARPPIAVIAGEIMTGKTSILELIAYCLGGKEHPHHPEIERQVRFAFLEVELGTDRHVQVIERPLFADNNVAWIHSCSLEQLDQPHVKMRKPIDPPHEDSLSWFLLEQCGLAGIALQESRRREDANAHIMSIRDVMWLCFLDDERIGSRNLLFENTRIKQVKLEQVIEVIFGVHDQQLTKLTDQLEELRRARSDRHTGLLALRSFLEEQEVAGPIELAEREETRRREAASLRAELAEVGSDMERASAHAARQRDEFASAHEAAGKAAATVRYQETLISRLLPLRAQYAEDERKLHFFSEANALIDPLQLTHCPSCQQPLDHPAEIVDGNCTLCGHSVPAGEAPLDVKSEINAVRARRRELRRYLDQIEAELTAARREAVALATREEETRRALDDAVAVQLAPYVQRRDQAVARLQRTEAAVNQLSEQRGWWTSVEQREAAVFRLDEQIKELRKTIERLQKDRPTKTALLGDMTNRFSAILESFGFPKLNDGGRPMIDEHFTPHVRGMEYRQLGSKGAKTLVGLAWTLSIFELALEGGHPHPGFLMIDSPQEGLKPGKPGEDQPINDEFVSDEIGVRVWERLIASAASTPGDPQLIVVDNLPRPPALPHRVVDYTGRAGKFPYGLIEDEQG